MVRQRRAVAAILFASTLACGSLESPDLQHGAVTGRIPGAVNGAYAYVLGSPEVLAPVASDGSFRLDKVPAGQPQIVLYDGASGAESVAVEVGAASISHLDPGRRLKPAGAILVAASPLSGASPKGLTFSVDGTPLRQVSGESGSAQLFPLPAGKFAVRATQPGFRETLTDVEVGEGREDSLEMDLEVDDEDKEKGCLSCGCEHGLACSSDGRCYQCARDSDCGPSGTCTEGHVCRLPPGAGQMCTACTAPSDCQGPAAACVNPTGAALAGYCSHTCSAAQDCPSGFDCQGGVCVGLDSCVRATVVYGNTCSEDSHCQEALKGGRCVPLDRGVNVAGYCSAPVQAGCPGGFAPDPGGSGFCLKSP